MSLLGWDRNRSRNIPIYILPNVNTTIVEPSTLCKDNTPILLIIVVSSAVDNFEIRYTFEMCKRHWHFTMNSFIKLFLPHFFDWILMTQTNITWNMGKHNRIQLLQVCCYPFTTGRTIFANQLSQLDELHCKNWQKSTKGIGHSTHWFHSFRLFYWNVSIFFRFWSNLQDTSQQSNDDISDKSLDIDPSHVNFQIRIVFLLGQTENNETQEQIVNESRTYNDLIQESFFDSYNNLTLKSVMMLKWITNNCDGKGNCIENAYWFLYFRIVQFEHVLELCSA